MMPEKTFYLLSGVAVTLLLAISMYVLMDLPLTIIIADAFIYTSILLSLSYLLLIVLKFGNFRLVPVLVGIVIYVLLGIFFLSILLGGNYLIEKVLHLSGKDNSFLRFIPLKVSFAVFVFTILYQKFNSKKISELKEEDDFQEMQIDNEETLSVPTEFPERITIKSGDKIHIIPLSDIICLLADGDYVQVVTEKGKFLKEQTMKYYTQHLPVDAFIRVHRSCIVQVSAISRIELYKKQNYHLILKNGEKVKVSQAGYKQLQEKLGM